mgnify:FL=1
MKESLLMLVAVMIGCTPGQSKQSGDAISDYQWEPGATEPRIQNGEVYCATDESGVVLTFINVTADDPQGVSDLKEGEWFAYNLESDELITSDVLYCDGQECIYSYHAEQVPELPCRQLTEFAFWAVVWDWSGNETPPLELNVLGEQ